MSWKRILAVCLFSLSLINLGCSNIPVSASYPMTKQRKMQAASHWDVLAQDVAQRIGKRIRQERMLAGRRLYVAAEHDTPFSAAFRKFLLTHLVKQSEVSVVTADKALCRLTFDAQLVEHKDNRTWNPPYKLTALGAGVFAVRHMVNWSSEHILDASPLIGLTGDVILQSGILDHSHTEVIISTSLWHNKELIHHSSDVYYINSLDWWHYENKFRTYHLVAE